MAEKAFEIYGFEELTKALDERRMLTDKVYFPLHDAMSEAVQQIEGAAKEDAPVAFGHLRASIGSEVRVTESAIEGVVGTNLGRIKDGKLLGYAQAVEMGTRPHWVPLEPLVEWVRVKRLAGRYSTRTRRRLGSKATQRAEDVAAARMIQFKIARHGTRAQPFFYPALEDGWQRARDLFEQAMEQIARNFNAGR
jgi:hypothetical protein